MCVAAIQPQVLKDAADDLRLFDAGNDLQRAAAMLAGLDLDAEDAFEALRFPGGSLTLDRAERRVRGLWFESAARAATRPDPRWNKPFGVEVSTLTGQACRGRRSRPAITRTRRN